MTRLETTEKNNWVYPPDFNNGGSPYGEDTTYKKAAQFLGPGNLVEDWGCGAAYACRFFTPEAYIGVDGASGFANKIADLRTYRSDVDGILLRHVLEHNWEWKVILKNALSSARNKLVLITFTPFSDVTHQIAWNEKEKVPDLSFCKQDLLDILAFNYFVTEETVQTDTQYGTETLFYVTK
jgi:hypothetical protein